MTYETWVLYFLGMLSAILLYNAVQWLWYRERIYGLYTGYMLVWLGYFLLRNPAAHLDLSEPTWNFLRTTGPMLAYIVYFEFTIQFLALRTWQPNLVRWLRYTQAVLAGYLALELYFCYGSVLYQQPIHDLIHTIVRLGLLGLSGIIITQIYRQANSMARLFITGSLMLVLGAVTAMILSFVGNGLQSPGRSFFWQAPLTYLHIGIILELIFFSLGLAYRHRYEAVQQALVDQQLARERDQHRREQAEAQLAVQQLKQQMTDMQMRALQAQISPHFLFNSLNTLSSLIADDPQRAETFVDELATVYRYLLQSNDQELTTLQKEMTFVTAYFNLLKTRYTQGIGLELSIDPTYTLYRLPSLTLQLLIENAVKHNIVSADQPLHIRIATNGADTLTVWNNLQRKTPGNGIDTQRGLLTISEKYRLLHLPLIHITQTEDTFAVQVPLLPPE